VDWYLVLGCLFKHFQRYIIPAKSINAQRSGESTNSATANCNFQNHFSIVSNSNTRVERQPEISQISQMSSFASWRRTPNIHLVWFLLWGIPVSQTNRADHHFHRKIGASFHIADESVTFELRYLYWLFADIALKIDLRRVLEGGLSER
jgi:hypothetical protein